MLLFKSRGRLFHILRRELDGKYCNELILRMSRRIVKRSFKVSKLLKMFSKDVGSSLFVYFYINIASLKSSRSLIFIIFIIKEDHYETWLLSYQLTLSLLRYLKTRICWGGVNLTPPSKSHV